MKLPQKCEESFFPRIANRIANGGKGMANGEQKDKSSICPFAILLPSVCYPSAIFLSSLFEFSPLEARNMLDILCI